MNHLLAWRIAVRESELDRVAKLVALTLGIYMNRRGIAWPSKQSLAEGTGYSIRTVDRAIIRLEQAGFLIVTRTAGRRSNRYTSVIHNPVTGDGVKLSTTPSAATPTPSRVTFNPVTGDGGSSQEVVIRNRGADRARDQNQNHVDPAVVELAHRWIADHRTPP